MLDEDASDLPGTPHERVTARGGGTRRALSAWLRGLRWPGSVRARNALSGTQGDHDIEAAVERIRRSDLFHSEWYSATYSDVELARVDPAEHFLLHGASEGRDPGPLFSTSGYLMLNPDVAKVGMNALLHYLDYGRSERRPCGVPRPAPIPAVRRRRRPALPGGRLERTIPLPIRPAPSGPERAQRLAEVLPLLQCPESGEELIIDDDRRQLVTTSGRHSWPIVAGRPSLLSSGEVTQVMPQEHLSNELAKSAVNLISMTDGWVLNLGAGGSASKAANVVEMEYSLFRNTDVAGDAHRLPFRDETFEAAIVMNAFEHLHTPATVAAELVRVLRPGASLLVHTAFLQPLHEAPHHYYNCTRYGLERWFEALDTQRLVVSPNFAPGYTISWIASEAEATLRAHLGAVAADEFLRTSMGEIVGFWRDVSTRQFSPWPELSALPQAAQERICAGFEYLGSKPPG